MERNIAEEKELQKGSIDGATHEGGASPNPDEKASMFGSPSNRGSNLFQHSKMMSTGVSAFGVEAQTDMMKAIVHSKQVEE